MIAYLDSSFVANGYFPDESGFAETRAVLEDAAIARITGTLTRIEVSGALVRAARAGRIPAVAPALARLDDDLGDAGPVAVLTDGQDRIEKVALDLSRNYGVRALDACHLAAATLLLPAVAEPGEVCAFATRDVRQAETARELGFPVVGV